MLTIEILKSWTAGDLIDFHNTNAAEHGQLGDAAKKKGKGHIVNLIADRIDIEAFDENGEAMETREVSDEPKGPTIRETALSKLCEVVYYEDKNEKPSDENRVDESHENARSVGLTYPAIIEAIKEVHPNCDTSVACLRWYAVKVRAEEHGYEGYRLPQRRPRAKKA